MSQALTAAQDKLRIRNEIKKCLVSKILYLSHTRLPTLPKSLLDLDIEIIQKIRHIDISHNHITDLPKDFFNSLHSLVELWLNNNPLTRLPSTICMATKLETIDIRKTLITELPSELALLNNLHTFDWRDTPLSILLLTNNNIEVNNYKNLKTNLVAIHTRKELEGQLLECLTGEKFSKEADRPGMQQFLQDLVYTLSDLFENLVDFRLFVRRADSILPDKTSDITPVSLQKVKENFFAMQRDTHRKRLAADVEIKLRSIYFDRIERSAVMDTIDSIYKHVNSLEDIQFLVKYASQVFPTTPDEANGELIWSNILDLQLQLKNKRDAAIKSLSSAMLQLYPEQRPETIQEKAIEVASVFAVERFATKRELNSLSQLAAEASSIFPVDYMSIVPKDIYNAAKSFFAR